LTTEPEKNGRLSFEEPPVLGLGFLCRLYTVAALAQARPVGIEILSMMSLKRDGRNNLQNVIVYGLIYFLKGPNV
jgi:hypothetical protein